MNKHWIWLSPSKVGLDTGNGKQMKWFDGIEWIEYDFDGDVHTWTNPNDGITWTMEKLKSASQEEWKSQRLIDMIWTMMEPGDMRNSLMDEFQRKKNECPN